MNSQRTISLGPHETRLLFDLELQGVTVFTLSEAQEILDLSESAAADVLYRLRLKGRVVEIRKGSYLLVPARAGIEGGWSESIFLVVDALVDEEYYVAFWAAMNYWSMTEQIPRVVHVVVSGRRRGFKFLGQRVRFVCLKPERVFGYVVEPLEKGRFQVSNREKTILDGLLLPAYCGGVGEVAKAISVSEESLRWSLLEEYVERLGVDAVRRRLGYLLDMLGIDNPFSHRWRKSFGGFRWLDPTAQKDRLSYSKEWGLIVNVEREDILGWREV